LDLRPSESLTLDALKQIIGQNPSLQYLCTDNVYNDGERNALNAFITTEISTRLKPSGITYKLVSAMFSPAGSFFDTDSDGDGWSDYDSSVSGEWGWGDHNDFDDVGFDYGNGSDGYDLDFGDSDDSAGSGQFDQY